MIIYEQSCGIIPFRRMPDGIEFLLLYSTLVRNTEAAWEFPKGHVEAGESEVRTALREFSEEVGIRTVRILPDFRDQISYLFRRGERKIEKSVTYFLGEVYRPETIPERPPTREHGFHPDEGHWYVWAQEHEIRQRLFHPGMRKLMGRTALFLHEHDRIQRQNRRR